MNELELLNRAISFFGIEKQQVVCIEEMAELTQQLSKLIINHKNKSVDGMKEEFVDTLIMLNQIKIIYNISDEEIENRKEMKYTKLQKYMDSYND